MTPTIAEGVVRAVAFGSAIRTVVVDPCNPWKHWKPVEPWNPRMYGFQDDENGNNQAGCSSIGRDPVDGAGLQP